MKSAAYLQPFYLQLNKASLYVPTTSYAVNKVLTRLYIDYSGYTGSYSTSGINIRIISRNYDGVWGFALNNGEGQLLAAFWVNSEKDRIEGIDEGIYAYAEFCWANMTIQTKIHGPITLTPFAFVLDPRIETRSSLIYASCGDSITEGAGVSDELPANDPYRPITGTPKATYAYWIAKHNNGSWYNYGISGTTLGDVNVGGLDKQGFSKSSGRYTNLANELTHISIFFGWNDFAYGPKMKKQEYATAQWGSGSTILYPANSTQLSNIGTPGWVTQEQYNELNSMTGTVGGVEYTNSDEYWAAVYIGLENDNTNKTFWGAWNIVLPYLINKYPMSKILLIVPYGTNSLMRQTVRNAAYKFGLRYYDFTKYTNQMFAAYSDENIQPSGRVNNVPISQFRQQNLYPDTAHPNKNGYEYMYPSINSLLMSL